MEGFANNTIVTKWRAIDLTAGQSANNPGLKPISGGWFVTSLSPLYRHSGLHVGCILNCPKSFQEFFVSAIRFDLCSQSREEGCEEVNLEPNYNECFEQI